MLVQDSPPAWRAEVRSSAELAGDRLFVGRQFDAEKRKGVLAARRKLNEVGCHLQSQAEHAVDENPSKLIRLGRNFFLEKLFDEGIQLWLVLFRVKPVRDNISNAGEFLTSFA